MVTMKQIVDGVCLFLCSFSAGKIHQNHGLGTCQDIPASYRNPSEKSCRKSGRRKF